MRVVALSNDRDSNSAAIRLGIPLRALAAQQPIELRMLSFHQCTRADLRWGEVFIVQRGINERTLLTMRRIRQLGKPVIYEIDDLLFQLPDFLRDYQTMQAHQDLVIAMIKMADVVSTTTGKLAAQLSPLNTNVKLVPNYAVTDGAPAARHGVDLAPRATLILAASDTVQTSFLLPVLKQLHSTYGAQVELACIGAIAQAIEIPGLTIHKHPIVPQADFAALITSFANPIGLIPMDDSLFSSCKTAIKFLDYAVAGIPSICSDVSPYRDVVIDRQTGLLVENTTEQWQQAIRSLIEDDQLRQRLCANAQAQIKERHNLQHTVRAWQDVLGSLATNQTLRRSPSMLEVARDAWCDFSDRAAVCLREWNRDRLLRRKAAKMRTTPTAQNQGTSANGQERNS